MPHRTCRYKSAVAEIITFRTLNGGIPCGMAMVICWLFPRIFCLTVRYVTMPHACLVIPFLLVPAQSFLSHLPYTCWFYLYHYWGWLHTHIPCRYLCICIFLIASKSLGSCISVLIVSHRIIGFGPCSTTRRWDSGLLFWDRTRHSGRRSPRTTGLCGSMWINMRQMIP